METIENVASATPEQAQSAPARTWRVKATAYRSMVGARPQVAFEFPAEIGAAIPAFTITQLDSEHWRIRPGGSREWRRVPDRSDVVRTTLAGDVEPFKVMTVEAIEVDGEILIHVPLEDRQRPQRREMPGPAPRLAPEAASSLEYRMRALLQDVREIEEASPYHLTRLPSGSLAWRAPTIE